MRTKVLLAVVVALAASVFAPSALAHGKAKLRVLHAAPDVPAVTVYLNGKKVVRSLDTLQATRYLNVRPGRYHVAVSLAGRPANEAALRATIRLKHGKRYTAVARGLLAQGTAELALQKDIRKAPRRLAALRVWHLSPDAPNVDVYVNGNLTLANVPYTAASGYLRVPAGRYHVRINVAGTDTNVFAGQVRLKRGRAYTAAALGAVAAEGAPFQVKVLLDAKARGGKWGWHWSRFFRHW